MVRWMLWLGAVGTIAGSACSGDTAGPAPGITVALSVQPALAEPGDTVRVPATAIPAGDVVVDVIRVTVSGLISRSDSVRSSGSGSQSFAQAYVLPFQPGNGAVSFVATARGGGGAGAAPPQPRVSGTAAPQAASRDAARSASPGRWVTGSDARGGNAGVACA